MRRDIGMVLAGLGAFLIVMAVVLPTYLAGQLIKFPLNYYYEAVLNSPDTTYFNASKGAVVTGANVNAIYVLKGRGDLGNSTTAVWDLHSYVYDTALPYPANGIQIVERQFAFDRKTAELKNCCGSNLNGQPVTQSGIAGYVWPIGTQPKSYQVFDTTLKRAVTFNYAGTDTVDGITVYKFTNVVNPTKIAFTPLSSVNPEYYALNLTYWVDPDTGALLKVSEHQQLYLVNSVTLAKSTVLFDGTFKPSKASVDAIVAIDNSGRLKKTMIETVLPIVFGVAGAILLVVGVLLARRRPGFTESVPAELGAEPAPAEGAARAELGAEPAAAEGAAAGSAAGERKPSPRHAAPESSNVSVIPGLDDPEEK